MEEHTIDKILCYLQKHLSEEITLEILAEKFQLNKNYVSQLFKKELDVNFHAYLTNMRMDKAKALLTSTQISIGEVARQSGYKDYRVFTKAFHRWEGDTPSGYRESTGDSASRLF